MKLPEALQKRKIYEVRKMEKKEGIQNNVEERTRPLANIGMAIIKAADYCFKEMKPFIDADDEKRRQELEIYLFYEFIYFFMHMTMRSAFGRLSEPSGYS